MSERSGTAQTHRIETIPAREGVLDDMQLLLGQRVDATDGAFGSITDIIIEPNALTVAHLVVQPFDDAESRRLVPSWLLRSEHGEPVIGLTTSYAMRLEMVSLRGLVSIAAGCGESKPSEAAVGFAGGHPSGALIGRPVRSLDGEFVGRIWGCEVVNRSLSSVLIRRGEPSVGRLATVPVSCVDAFRAQHIDLCITHRELDRLCSVDQFASSARRQRNYERDTIHAARRSTLQRRPQLWTRRKTWQ